MATDKEISSPSDWVNNCEQGGVPQDRPPMPMDLYQAALDGNGDVLERDLGLSTYNHNHIMVTVETCDPDTQEIHENKHKLESATTFGDTVLHILVANMHNELALRVFQKDESLLIARNKKLETPLHLAAKIGNVGIIESFIEQLPYIVKDALEETNIDGDATLHLAIKHGHVNVVDLLLKFNKELTYKVNKKEQSPFQLAILEKQIAMMDVMLEFDHSLASIPFSNGMFPIHLAARMGQGIKVYIILEKFPDYSKFKDQQGRNFFHIAADENSVDIFSKHIIRRCARMLIEKDYDGNTPLHIAARKGHRNIMENILVYSEENIRSYEENKEGLTPFDCSILQLQESNQEYDKRKMKRYVENYGPYLKVEWIYGVMKIDADKRVPEAVWQKVQLIGLGSVLITTVSFAAAFTFPGGYDQNTGTPILGRRFMFRAFILANALAFIRSLMCVFTLVTGIDSKIDPQNLEIEKRMFFSSVTSMMVAFGTGSYVMLAPLNMPIAVIILVLALLLGNPLVLKNYYKMSFWWSEFISYRRSLVAMIVQFFDESLGLIQVFPFVFAFCLAYFLK